MFYIASTKTITTDVAWIPIVAAVILIGIVIIVAAGGGIGGIIAGGGIGGGTRGGIIAVGGIVGGTIAVNVHKLCQQILEGIIKISSFQCRDLPEN